MIQGVITRMSGFSASAKTFTITIIAGLAAISLQAETTKLGVIAMIAAVAFFLVDTYYMTLEVRFRNFYDEVATRDLDQATNLKIAPPIARGDTRKAINSKSNWLFYGPVMVACVLFVCYGSVDGQRTERLPGRDTTRVERRADPKSATAGKHAEPFARPAAAAKGDIGRLPEQATATPSAERPVWTESKAERSERPVRADATGNTAR